MMKQSGSIEDERMPAWKHLTFLTKTNAVFSFIGEWLNLASVAIIMFLMFFTVSEIVGRYVFNAPIPGHVEIVELIMAGVVFLGIAHTEKEGGHVRMELFLTKVLKNRAYHIAEAITIALSFFVYAVILVYSFKSTVSAYTVGDTTGYIYWPTWPSKLAIPVGSFFLCIRFIIEFIQHVSQAIAGGEMRNLS